MSAQDSLQFPLSANSSFYSVKKILLTTAGPLQLRETHLSPTPHLPLGLTELILNGHGSLEIFCFTFVSHVEQLTPSPMYAEKVFCLSIFLCERAWIPQILDWTCDGYFIVNLRRFGIISGVYLWSCLWDCFRSCLPEEGRLTLNVGGTVT